MIIAVAILARENPIGLITLVGGLHALASGKNDVRYIVRYDHDDVDSLRAITLLQDSVPEVIGMPGDQPLTLGAAWNEAMRAIGDWEICSTFPNDVVPMADGWDAGLSEVMADIRRPAVSWGQLCDPNNPVYPAVRREWFDALGRLFPEIFPFWFADTWVAEVHQLALGSRLPIVRQLVLGGKHGPTHGMRELAWWFDFFGKTRPLRVQEATQLAKALGRPALDMAPALAKMAETDAMQQTRVPLYKEWFHADVGEPTQRYLTAKAKAEELLKGILS